MVKNESETAVKSVLDEKVTVTLTWFELKKIRDWNLKRMDSAAQALENPIMKPAKRSRWQVEYDFHTQLCDHLHGVDVDEEDIVREHNENVKSGIEVMERMIAEMVQKKAYLKTQLI